jgi:Rrf2 family protein
MLDLAIHHNGTYIPLSGVARRQEISGKYLEQIAAQLHKAGYVRSSRGAQGGYRLSKEPSAYTVGMILRLMEGSLAPVDCVLDDAACHRASFCVSKEIWKNIKDAVDNVIDNMTLADLVFKYNSEEIQAAIPYKGNY